MRMRMSCRRLLNLFLFIPTTPRVAGGLPAKTRFLSLLALHAHLDFLCSHSPFVLQPRPHPLPMLSAYARLLHHLLLFSHTCLLPATIISSPIPGPGPGPAYRHPNLHTHICLFTAAIFYRLGRNIPDSRPIHMHMLLSPLSVSTSLFLRGILMILALGPPCIIRYSPFRLKLLLYPRRRIILLYHLPTFPCLPPPQLQSRHLLSLRHVHAYYYSSVAGHPALASKTANSDPYCLCMHIVTAPDRRNTRTHTPTHQSIYPVASPAVLLPGLALPSHRPRQLPLAPLLCRRLTSYLLAGPKGRRLLASGA